MAMIARRRFASLLPFGLLAACTRIGQQQPGGLVGGHLVEEDQLKMGLVVGSLGTTVAERHRFPLQQMWIRRLRTHEPEVVASFAGLLDEYPPNYLDNVIRAEIFALRIPEGWYEIYNFQIRQDIVDDKRFLLPKRLAFSILFRVDRGKVAYVGEYLTQRVDPPWTDPAGRSIDARMEIGDQRARDLTFAKTKWPDFNFDDVNFFIPNARAMNHPFFAPARPRP